MITDQDVTKLKKTFATHEDLKKLTRVFLTKEEFKKAAKAFATKKDLAVQTERIDALVYEVGDLKVMFAEFREELYSFVESMHTKMDRFLEKMDRLDLESKVCSVVQERHTQQIGMLALSANITLPE